MTARTTTCIRPTWHEEAKHSAAMEDSHDFSALV